METYLFHHGIKGQKWGIRRYQNPDGSYTNAGKQRRSEMDPERKKQIKKNVGKAAAFIGVAALGTAATLYAVKHPDQVKDFIKSNSKKALSAIGESTKKAGKAAYEAALISIGGIAITKLSEKMGSNDNDTESQKNTKKIALDASTAAIKSVTNSVVSSSSNNKNSGANIGKDVSDKIGAPSNKGIDRSSKEYQALFKDSSGNNRDDNTRATIKSLANAGYDIEQIDRYLNHSMAKSSKDLVHGLTIGQMYICNIL